MAQDSKISIVDDDESIRSATASLLRSYGFRTTTFSSAEEFLRSPHVNDTSCLISDVQMPGMTGPELQSRLLELGNNVPIIFMTAFPDDRIHRQVDAAGAVAFLRKPFDSKLMVECVDKALHRSHQ
ncbi:response regulator transcription factor [Hyphomicrobium facile]|uniref:Response regulator receiver domain-containing protein n=1 Tax=Hyphomicrobium facile TaxID=51670 RepID=A0A1I7NQW6_9HYPH|nr:response regulator [Hyphomicrobium facile]SFV37059.1 Response regulator receiver domain-containing protein [Hyphomicrobium facile]